MIASFDASPIPNHRIASGITASGGTGRSSSISGSNSSSAIGEAAIAAASGSAITSAIAKPSITRRRLTSGVARQRAVADQLAIGGQAPRRARAAASR